MRFKLIDEEKSRHTVSRIARAVGVSRAGYYAARSRPVSECAVEDAGLSAHVKKIFTDSHETYGSPRIHAELRLAYGIFISEKRVARLMETLAIAG